MITELVTRESERDTASKFWYFSRVNFIQRFCFFTGRETCVVDKTIILFHNIIIMGTLGIKGARNSYIIRFYQVFSLLQNKLFLVRQGSDA